MESAELTTISNEQQEDITRLAQTRNALIAFTKEVLIRDIDFGVIPGVQKPTLLKPGAEKLMNLYNYSVEFECVDKVLDLNTKFMFYTYKATLRNREGYIKTQCEGSVNSYEPKYRYTWVEKVKPSQAEQDRLKAEGTGKFKKGASGWIWVERVENPDVIGLQNTMQKMAQKRAFVGAVLLFSNASEFFTQDVEDMGFIDVEATIVDDPTPAVVKAEPVKPAVPKPADPIPDAVPEQKEKSVKSQVPDPAIPGEVRLAIAQAQDVAALYLVHKNNAGLHNNDQFIKLLSAKKAEIRKSVAA